MVKFDSIDKALFAMERNILDSENKVMLAISSQFAKDAKQQFIAFQSGALGDSGIRTPKNLLMQGTVVWDTPYALTRYKVNYKTPNSTFWDTKTWDANYQTYEKQAKIAWEKDIFK